METKLFVIKQVGRNLFWTCSAEHGSGWNEGNPKQSFSPSELVKELRRLIDEKWFTDVEICELRLTDHNGPQCEASMPQGMEASPRRGLRCQYCGQRPV